MPENVAEPVGERKYFKRDRVEILVGKDKGKQGTISMIIQERNWVIVEGLNCTYRFMGKTGDFPGVYSKWEMPLLIDREVSLVDPADSKPVKVEWRFTEEGEKVRVSLRSGRLIPMPELAEETKDYKKRSVYIENDKDTVTDDLTIISFEPKLKTFQMDLMDEMGIVETRTPGKTWWY